MGSIKNKLMKWLLSDAKGISLGTQNEDDIRTLQEAMSGNLYLPNNTDNQAVWSNWSTGNAIEQGMKSSTYVYACIDRLMKSAGSVPWNAYIRNKDGEWEESHDHPLEQLIQQPNPFMSRKQLIEIITAHLYLGGNAVLQKIQVRGTTVELWPIAPDDIKPVPSKKDFISRYEYNRNGKKKDYKPEEIAHFMFVDPANMYWGISPLQAGAKTVDTDVQAVEWNKVALQNRAVADGIFTFDEVMTQEQWEEARKMIREQHQGKDNARTPWVLGAGASWHQMSLSPVEMDFLNSRKMTIQEICSIFQVPPPMVGIYEDATLANIETARKIFWLDTIIPFLDGIQEVLNRALADEFTKATGKEVWLGYDISNVQALQENLGEKITNAKALFDMGIPFNDINNRLELGFDAISGGNNGWLPMNLIPTSYKPDDDGGYVEVIEEDEKALSKLDKFEEQLKLATSEVKYFNLETDEQKEIHWKKVDGRRRKWESQVAGMVGRQFDKESDKVIKAYKRGSTSEAIKEIDKQVKSWETLYTAFYTEVMQDFGDEATISLGKSANMKIETKFNPFETGVQDWIKYMVGRNIKNIGKTTKDRVKREISLGLEDGEDSQGIAQRLQGLYKSMSERRALTIARTEVGSAMNAGSHFAIEQTGLQYDRVWLSSMDDRTRDSHADMDGVTVAEGDPFDVNGSQMMFPGDSSMGADEDEIIHCRCVETYQVRR